MKKKKDTKLIIDGHLIARKSFYKFRNLSTKVPIKALAFLSKNIEEQALDKKAKEENPENEFISEESGKTLSLNQNGRIEKKIRELSLKEETVTLNTGILYGMLRSILVAYEKYDINEVVICYDPIYKVSNKPQFRKELIADYKNRKKDPEIEILFSEGLYLTQAFFYKAGVPQTTTKRFEADDILQYYSHKKFKKDKCLVLTNDHDLFQLLEPNRVKMLRLGGKGSVRSPLYTATDFRKEFGISPKQWKDVLALGGCSTDNVKGIKGISSNKAVELIRNYKSLNNLIKTYKSNPPEKRIITALDKEAEQGWGNLKLAYRLVSLYGLKKELKDDISTIKSSKSPEICLEHARTFLNILEFKSFLTKPAQSSLKSLIF